MEQLRSTVFGLHYVTGGNGPALVLIHRLPASWYEWRGILPALAARYKVIVPDLRGLGDSSKPPGGYNTHTASEDIHQLVRSMGIDQVYVAGHDWGAAVGFAYAARYPQEVRRLAPSRASPQKKGTVTHGKAGHGVNRK